MTANELECYVLLYRSTVYRLAFSYVKNNEDAEDISQEAFLKLYKSKEDFKTAENVKAWLIRVTINLSKNLLKTIWRQKRSELSYEIPFETEKEEILMGIISKMKPKYAVILHLFYYEDYSVKEIAYLLKITSETVRTRLTRARGQLKEMLLKEGYDEKGIQ